jgi:hypothetical protein
VTAIFISPFVGHLAASALERSMVPFKLQKNAMSRELHARSSPAAKTDRSALDDVAC